MRLLLASLIVLAAPAIAQPSPAQVRYVFFDWGKEELSNDSKATLDAVAAEYASSPRPLMLSGYSDRSGAPGKNLRRSKVRAQIVGDYLAGKGVPAASMTIAGYGEARPLIATEDGVREVQNRRVEIRFGDR